MDVREKLSALRKKMREHGLQAYIVPTDDFHGSEYVGEYFKTREYMSGFTGSAGTLVVTEQKALLWTDGRYFLQAGTQLENSTIGLMKVSEAGIPDIPQYLAADLPEKACIGFDGRTMTMEAAGRIRQATENRQMRLISHLDLCGEIWTDRPALSAGRVWELGREYTGQSRREKLDAVREKMEKNGADYLLLSALDETAWMTNLRGSDIDYTPVFLSYMLVGKETARLFVQPGVISQELSRSLSRDGVELAGYEQIYTQMKELPGDSVIWIDGSSINYCLFAAAAEGHVLLMEDSPVTTMKAVKNSTEIRHLKEAHVKDGVAVTRLMHWMKTRAGVEEITEIQAAKQLKVYRQQMEGYLEESFAPIIAYGAHGAIIHYEADENTNAVIEPGGLCLTDTGGQYLEGTTDVSRTFVLGAATAEEKKLFTLVLKGHLRLGAARFKYGVCGQNLDYLARAPLWAEGLDFNHGTGHGVGYLLNVHEGPQRIQWRIVRDVRPVPLEAGMLVSNEPGVYLEGKFGIRHENLLLCCRDRETEYGQFLRFENLTMVPFDRDGIDVGLLSRDELDTLNAYHALVFENLSPWFGGEELEWLREVTQPLAEQKDGEKWTTEIL